MRTRQLCLNCLILVLQLLIPIKFFITTFIDHRASPHQVFLKRSLLGICTAKTRLCRSILWSMREISFSDQSYEKVVSALQRDLRQNYHDYRRCNLICTEQARLFAVRFLPFRIYLYIEQIWSARKGK